MSHNDNKWCMEMRNRIFYTSKRVITNYVTRNTNDKQIP
jgi:hypothetical protein